MRRFVLCTCWALFTAAAFAQPRVAFGERIGMTLDAEERAYFGLFPEAPDDFPFRFQAVEGSVRVVGADGAVLLTLSAEEAGRLVGLIDTFEDYPDVISNPGWEPKAGFMRLIDARTPVPHAAVARRIRATTAEGSYSGFVLYTTDSLLVLAPHLVPTDPTLPGAFVLERRLVESMDRVAGVTWQRWGPYVGAALGAGVGATFMTDRPAGAAFGLLLGATLAEGASRLRGGDGGLRGPRALDGITYFDGVRPPEMPGPEVASTLVDRPAPPPDPVRRRSRRHEWISVGVHGGVDVREQTELPTISGIGVTAVDQQGQAVSFRPLDVRTRRFAPAAGSRLDVAVRPLPWVRFGAYVGPSDSLRGGAAPGTEGSQTVGVSFEPVRPYAEAVLPLVRIGRRRIEAAVGAGHERHTLTALQAEPDLQNGYPVERPAGQVTTQAGANWFTHVALEVYTTPFSSLFVRHAWHPLPSLDVEGFASRHRTYAPLTLRVLPPHTIDFGFTELIIGARAHF